MGFSFQSPCGVAVERRAHARVLAPPAAPHVGHLVHARLAAQLMEEASQEFPHLREHATFLDGCGHLLCWVHCPARWYCILGFDTL